MKSTITAALLFLLSTTLLAANGGNGLVSGKVLDKKTGEELIGVSVVVEGSSMGTVTDIEGKYTLSVPPGNYNLVFTYVSYNKKIIKGVEVKQKETVVINPVLEESTRNLNEVVITAELKKETASALMIQQKKSASISDGISADMIRKTPDATTGDVMKRISGTTIQDNRFAIIRGLNDRYNTAYINGAPLPSTESDRKAFSFDIFPSSMLDNMVITKTATPDMPGDFAGGMITINTKDIPEKFFVSASTSVSTHSISTGKPGYENTPGSTNFFGVDNGTRALPGDIPARLTYEKSTSLEKLEASRKFSDNWTMQEIAAMPMNSSFQLSAGNNFKFNKIHQAGFIVSLSRSKSYRITPSERNKFQKNMNVAENQFQRQYQDTVYKQEVLSGVMLNAGWKMGNSHKLSFKNSYTVNTEDQTISRSGYDDLLDLQTFPLIRNQYFMYQDNRLMSNQVIGEHFMSTMHMKVKWVLNNNTIHRSMPDFRRVSTRTSLDEISGEYYNYAVQVGPNIDITQTGRFYQDLKENIQSAGADFQLPLEFIPIKKLKTELKFGGFYQVRKRDFQVRAFGYKLKTIVKAGNPYNYQTFIAQDPSLMFSSSNLAQDTFYIDERINPQDVYDAGSNLQSAYLMLDQRFLSRFRAVYGVRMERYKQELNSLGSAGEPVNVDTVFTDFLPSLNLTYELTSKVNLRLSGSQTVARPEFRELAPFSFYDFNYNTVITGNPNLVRTKINNYDFRFEFYPGEAQMISVSVFYKDFKNAIEQVNEFQGSDPTLGYSSNTNATNYGFEIEARKNFGFLDNWIGVKGFRNFSFTLNYALIRSEVKFDQNISSTNNTFGTRPLQGQSPFIFNGSFQYYSPKANLSAAIFVNRVGRRITFVREKNGLVPDLWENPRTVVDFSVSKTFFKHYEFKFGVNDILAQDLIFYQDNNGNGKYDDISVNVNPNNGPTPRTDPNVSNAEKSSYDNPLIRYKMGYTLSVGISVKF